MRFLKGLNSKKKDKNGSHNEGYYGDPRQTSSFVSRPSSTDLTAKLPAPLLEKIFAAICPHTQDSSYESCEQSAVDNACMLCDLRDLAHCAAVSRRWRKLAANVLYYSIRIDTVHYCEREEILAEKRKRRSFFDRNAEPEDTPQQRLKLLCRTLREDNSGLGLIVRFFKIPYMTREACKTDIARTIAVLPKLRYVDLPEGFFTDDPTCNTLKQELQARCPDIRKMSYMTGSERSFELLSRGSIWRNLEVLELNSLNCDPTMLRFVFGALTCLRAVKITDMEILDDSIFQYSQNLPPFPALTELLFEHTPKITSSGIVDYLSNPHTATAIRTLSFTGTGVHPSTLQPILAAAPNLQSLSIIEQVSTSFPSNPPTPTLSSQSLETLHYEITSASSNKSYTSATTSYYAYLTSSLLAHGLPNLQQVYVLDPDFADSLIQFTPPMPAFAADYSSPKQSPTNININNRSPNLSPNPFIQVRPDSVTSDYGSPPRSLGSNNPFSPTYPPTSPSAGGLSPRTAPTTAGSGTASTSRNGTNATNNGILKQELEVYAKSSSELEWNFARVEPPTSTTSAYPPSSQTPSSPSSSSLRHKTSMNMELRPVSMYGLAPSSNGAGSGSAGGLGHGLSPTKWTTGGFGGGDVRKSTVVNFGGVGGFLAVPGQEEDGGGGDERFPGAAAGGYGRRPGSSGSANSGGGFGGSGVTGAAKRSSKYDIWR